MIRIIDKKKVDLTDDEFDLYQKICKSYTTSTNRGEDYFTDLFESDKDGIILFIKPPSTHRTSLEIFLFITSIMIHQQLRRANNQIDNLCSEFKLKFKELEDKLNSLSLK